ncbi:unnamed protein product, partial [Mesorhabditis belari]|uniref:Uncharacterized protein n=1 Tax=Mesorhabditis belari TaxID=2138241 RepID=A0AAF3EJM1_9BILA
MESRTKTSHENLEEGEASTTNSSTKGNENATAASSANTDKRARTFDLTAIFEETKRTAQTQFAESHLAKEEEKGSEHSARQGTSKAQTSREKAHENSDGRGTNSDGNGAGPVAAEEADSDDDFMPSLPPGFAPKNDQSAKDDESDGDDFADYAGEGLPVIKLIPAASEVTLEHGSKMAVTAIAFDGPGTRFLAGGYDCSLSICGALRKQCDSSPFFSPNGESIIVCNGSPQVILLDRRGTRFGETVRGDQYLVDLSNTKGHTATVMCSVWNPIVKGEFLTCSDDGTIRFWHLDDFKQITKQINKQRKIIKLKNANGKRAQPQTCALSFDGKLVAAGCGDGSLQVWKNSKIIVSTTYLVRKAHNGAITCVRFSHDGKRLLTRGLDGALKLWSLDDNKAPLKMKTGLHTEYKESDCGWAPRGEVIYVTCSPATEGGAGSLQFLDPETFEVVYKIEYPNGVSAIRCIWHPRLNQMLVSLSDGTLRIYYDPETSLMGIKQCVTRPLRRSRAEEVIKEEMILAPLALEMFQGRGEEPEDKEVTEWRLRRYLRMKDNEIRKPFKKPAEMPLSGPSTGGRINKTGGTIHSFLAQQMGKERNKDFLADNDVRASILRHAEAAEAEPLYVAKAYAKTQPVTLFQNKIADDDDEEEEAPMMKRPKRE